MPPSLRRLFFYQLQRKTLLTTCLIVATIYMIYFIHDTMIQPRSRAIFSHLYHYFYPRNSIQCYHSKADTLADISDGSPAKGKSIFFHETSCNSHFNGKIFITARQACAVESAARMNPNFEIHLLFASPGVFKFEGTRSDRFLEALLSYSNVRIHHVDYERYTKGTPVEGLYKKGLEVSWYAQWHASDVLRYLTLYKYGGIYLDLDVIVIKPLEALRANYAGSESSKNVAAGVLNFSPDGLGHELAKRCLDDLSKNFKGYDWGYNGPGVITRLLRDMCGVNNTRDMERKCQGFKVYPKNAFYPISWWDWMMYFDDRFAQKVMNISKESFVVHVWNKHSAHKAVEARGRSAYAIYAQKFCPRVVNQCGFLF